MSDKRNVLVQDTKIHEMFKTFSKSTELIILMIPDALKIFNTTFRTCSEYLREKYVYFSKAGE